MEPKVEREEIIARVKQRAVDNFKSGLNCAESVFMAILAESDTDLPPEVMCLVTGFGSGGGLFGGTCGSLNGAIAALGLVYGRRQPPSGSPEEKKAQLYGNPGTYRIFNRLSNVFQEQFGTTLCRDITKPWHGEWFARDRLKTCLKTVAFTAEKAAEMVFPADRERWGSHPLGENLLGEKE
jgi:C_GCAxxG_C_C family probable redox protein